MTFARPFRTRLLGLVQLTHGSTSSNRTPRHVPKPESPSNIFFEARTLFHQRNLYVSSHLYHCDPPIGPIGPGDPLHHVMSAARYSLGENYTAR